MLEKETDIIIQILTESTLGERMSISFRQVTDASMPKGIKTFIQNELIDSLQTELASNKRFASIQRSNPGANQLERTFLRSLSLEYEFTRKEFIESLRRGTVFTKDYLCRPQWALHKFIFSNQDVVSIVQLNAQLEYCFEYLYFKSLLDRIIRQRGWREIRSAEFRSLLASIDAEVVKEHSPRELALLSKPIFDFFLLGDASLTRPIPIDPILIFFEDKGLAAVKNYVQGICNVRGRKELSIAELIGILNDLNEVEESTNGEPEVEPEIHQASPAPERSPVIDTIETPPVEASEPRELGENEIPLELVSPEITPLSVVEPPTEDDISPEMIGELPDLEEMLTPDQKKNFIKKIFKKDDAYFSIFLTQLNKTTSWKEATAYLKDLYEINLLDPISEEVIEFTGSIHKRYL